MQHVIHNKACFYSLILWIYGHFILSVKIFKTLSNPTHSLHHHKDCHVIEGEDAHAHAKSQIAPDIRYKTIAAIDIVLLLCFVGSSFKEEHQEQLESKSELSKVVAIRFQVSTIADSWLNGSILDTFSISWPKMRGHLVPRPQRPGLQNLQESRFLVINIIHSH
jgi:hypothetical protein